MIQKGLSRVDIRPPSFSSREQVPFFVEFRETHSVARSLGEVPSLFDILTYLPITGKIKKLERAAEKLLVRRELDSSASQSDLVSHLVRHWTYTFSFGLIIRFTAGTSLLSAAVEFRGPPN